MKTSDKPLPIEKLAAAAEKIAACKTNASLMRAAWHGETVLGSIPESQHFEAVEAAKNLIGFRVFDEEGKKPATTQEVVAARNAQKALDVLFDLSQRGMLVTQTGGMERSAAPQRAPLRKKAISRSQGE